MDPEVEERLRKGAEVLGKYWAAGIRCSSGFGLNMSAFPENVDSDKVIDGWACQCVQKTPFCKAKAHWLKLALTDLRGVEDGAFGVALMMTAAEWDLTKIIMKVDIVEPKVGIIRVGTKGMISMTSLWKTPPETLESILKLMKVFPGAQIEGLLDPPPVAAAIAEPGSDVEINPEALESF